MATKHDLILKYIRSLPAGEKISVRAMAKQQEVSEGTAYRAIKDAERMGLVTTIPRVGTVRIKHHQTERNKKLTYREVVNIVDGVILGGEAGLDEPLDKFVIGAMEEEAVMRYIRPNSLLIVGNRENIQEQALKNGTAVLITGGFSTSQDIQKIANQKQLPVISTTYDSFSVATMINRALSDHLIKQEIMVVDDIQSSADVAAFLYEDQTIDEYKELSLQTRKSRFPVLTKEHKLVGIVTGRDVKEAVVSNKIMDCMTSKPSYVQTGSSVASAAHLMVWEGFDLLPVVDDNLIFQGVVTRADVLQAMQINQRQGQSDTFADQIASEVVSRNPVDSKQPLFETVVTPQMINSDGTLSHGVLAEMMINVARRTLEDRRYTVMVEQMNVYYFQPAQLENHLRLYAKVLDDGRRSSKIEVEVYIYSQLVAKALMTCHLMEGGVK